ncbi:acyltransferase family protein [Glutamicibacter protophormiae]|uniref:acyltransferase family protein n=1 Tax=Glutamicibacter protophormiae TaxID=37930 RepID=UPI002A8303A3|nr:acyltransferase family protein [Glutamicibacter protophormiae]WPR66192.1 acyltransferase family protein [Glutamicibacter protophormiae]WPR69688.1 acyltransferase family protein [Glutamicibacter protophormiae]
MSSAQPIAGLSAPGRKKSVFRSDIQGLRALAVGLVVIYHFWPKVLPGGFIGVDVFFVISGFLITSHLLTKPPRRIRDIGQFWMRRVKRLLPASFLVVLISLLGVWLLAPETLWQDWGLQAIASTFYFQNWFLATSKVDYLAEADAPSPFQHFWSLSTEEQFYLVWPILIGLLVLLAIRWGRKTQPVALSGIAFIFAVSLGYSVYATATDPGVAYFSTFTRGWEFAAGALVAALGARAHAPKSDVLSAVAAWVGLGAIVISALTFTGEMPFPGALALLPVAGTALLILAHAKHSASPKSLLGNKVVRLVGDNSYAIYLWHWPLLILLPYTVTDFGNTARLLTLALTVALAVWTQVFVETKFRTFIDTSKSMSAPRFLVVGSAVLAMIAGGLYTTSGQVMKDSMDISASIQRVEESLGRACVGPNALTAKCPAGGGIDEQFESLAPAPLAAKNDRPKVYADDCLAREGENFADRPICRYGEGDLKVALVGNSHAVQWFPAVESLAGRHGWSLDTYLISRCAVNGTRQMFENEGKIEGCADYEPWVSEQLSAQRYDLIIASSRQSLSPEGYSSETGMDASRRAFSSTLDSWTRTGAEVVVIADTPFPGATLENVPDCAADNLDQLSKCSGNKMDWLPADPLADAAKLTANDRVNLIDMNDYLCSEEVCYGIIGGMIAFWDHSHLSNTYAHALSPMLEQKLQSKLSKSDLFASD